MRIITAICLIVALSGITPRVSNAQDAVPEFLKLPKVDTAQFALAVNHFVAMGETKAIQTLKAIRARQTFRSKIDVHFRLACICRVLWQNSDQPIAPPHMGMYGGGVSIGAARGKSSKDWPMYPVAKAGDSYFIVVYGGRFGTGNSYQLNLAYLAHCQTSGRFLTKKIPVPTKQDAERDAKKLLQSTRWMNEFSDQRKAQKARAAIESQIPQNATKKKSAGKSTQSKTTKAAVMKP